MDRSAMETIETTATADRSAMETIGTAPGDADRASMATIATSPTGMASVATTDRSAMETIQSQGLTDDAATRPMMSNPADSVTLVALHGPPGARPRSDMPVPAVSEHEGRYRHIKVFSSGGMGQITLVHDTHLGRDIALKTLLPDRVPGNSKTRTRTGAPTMEVLTVPIIARFLQEAHVTGQLQHPGIIPIYELGYRADGTLYYTMQFLRGQSIQDKLKDATTLQERLPLLTNFLDACHAIGYAHSRGVVHRDIKPMNIMTGAFGETVVIDWGIAKVKGEQDIHARDIQETVKVMQIGDTQATARTMYGQTIGSPFYMPPEQAAGRTDEVDERADIYSLGALLYVILTGVPPYHGMNVREFLVKVQEFDPKPVLELQKDAPRELAAIVHKAMARKREDRYQSAMELADEVQRYLSGGLVSAYQYRFAELVKRFYKRNRNIIHVTAGAAVAVLTAITIGVTAVTIQRAIARRELYFANINIAQDAIEERTPEAARKRLADAPTEHNNWEWGYLAHAASAGLMTLPASGQNIAFGEGFVVIADDQGKAEVFNTATGERTHTLLQRAGTGYGFDFAKAAGRVAILGDDGVRVWDANTGTELFRLEDKPYEAEQITRQVALSDDGRRLALLTTDGAARVVDLERKTEIYNAPMEVTHSLLSLSADGALLLRCSTGMTEEGDFVPMVEVVDVAYGQTIASADIERSGAVKTMVVAPGNTHLAIATDNTLQLFALPGMQRLLDLPGRTEDGEVNNTGVTLHFNVPGTVAFSPNGQWLAAGTKDGRLGLWDVATGAENVLELFAHGDQIRSVAFSPDGRYLATASFDHGVKLWELPNALHATMRYAHEFVGHDGQLWVLDFAPDGTQLATTAFGDTTMLWDMQAEMEFNRPTALAFDPQRDWVAGALGTQVAVWDARTHYRIASLSGHTTPVKYVAFAQESAHLATVSIAQDGRSGEARIWKLPSGEAGPVVPVSPGVSQLALARDGSLLITRDKTAIRVLRASDGGVAFEGTCNGAFVTAPGGERMAFAADAEAGGHTLTVVDLATMEASQRFTQPGRKGATPALALDAAGKWLAATAWNEDGAVDLVLYPLAGGDPAVHRTTHTNFAGALVFSPEGDMAATGSRDASINVFRVNSREAPIVLRGHSGSVMALSFAPRFSTPFSVGNFLSRPNHTRLASASIDKTFRLWNVERASAIITVHDEAQQAQGDVITPARVAFNAEGDLLATITTPVAVPPFVSRAFPWNIRAYKVPRVDEENISEDSAALLTFKGMMEQYKREQWQK
jgi:serine/threonine protein kinase/WD40 repeat protein